MSWVNRDENHKKISRYYWTNSLLQKEVLFETTIIVRRFSGGWLIICFDFCSAVSNHFQIFIWIQWIYILNFIQLKNKILHIFNTISHTTHKHWIIIFNNTNEKSHEARVTNSKLISTIDFRYRNRFVKM